MKFFTKTGGLEKGDIKRLLELDNPEIESVVLDLLRKYLNNYEDLNEF